MRNLLYIYLLSIIPIFAKGQIYDQTRNKIFKQLQKNKGELNLLTNNSSLFPVNIKNEFPNQNIIKNKNGIFATIDGTGRLYKAFLKPDSSIEFKRIDSTKFFGHSFQSIDFSFNNIIYSFGGYGFWHHNGQLRHYDFNLNEWVVDKINKEFNTTNFLVNFQPKESKLFYIVEPKNGETTYENISEYQIIEFDLIKKKNTLLGELDNHIKLQNPKYINTPNLGGSLVYSSGDYYLLNFIENKVLRLNNDSLKDLLNGKLNKPVKNTFEEGSNIYFTYGDDTTIHNFKISQSDFIEESYPIYNTKSYTLVLLLVFAIIAIAVYITKYRKSILAKDNVQVDSNDLNDFNEVERSLIEQIIIKANKGVYLNVEEVNTYLGIKRKSIEIQKKIRNESISRINHKFKLNYNQDSIFIERIRSSNDKRVFNYTINLDNIDIYMKK